MRIENSLLIAGIVIVVLLAFSLAFAARRIQRLSNGVWGGQHIQMQIDKGFAKIEYDCATGEITGPFPVDAAGRFNWRGYFTPQRPGPIRLDKRPARMPAVYSGSITGDTMSLTVKLADGQTLDTFTLKRGAPGRVWKCK